MVSLSTVRSQNATLKSRPGSLVAVFVGGTSGIGLFTARELVRNTASPRVYLIGRNAGEASNIIEELRSINPGSHVSFIQKDVSLLRNVDEACREIKLKETAVNLLFMTCGYTTLKGRDETAEGLDRKFALHYYTRMRFIQQLSPLLQVAANSPSPLPAPSLSRVVAVLDPQPGLRLTPNWADLSLKTHFSLQTCVAHTTAMTNLAMYHLAAQPQHAGTTFIHAYPSAVATGTTRELFGAFEPVGKFLLGLASRWFVPQQESGERHLFAATAPMYPPRGVGATVEGAISKGETNKGTAASDAIALGSDSVRGSGSYLLNWNGEVFGDTKKALSMRDEGKDKVVWEHTEEVFRKICDEEGGKY